MGRITTPKYRIEMVERQPNGIVKSSTAAWRGQVSEKRVEEYMLSLNKSFLPGGVNSRASELLGYVPYSYKALVVEQATGQIVARWKAPMFQVM